MKKTDPRLKKPGEASITVLFSRYKNNARSRGHRFDLSREQFVAIISKNCTYCNTAPVEFNSYLRKDKTVQKIKGRNTEFTIDRSWIKANGIDRLDNNSGYVEGNVVACCKFCNLAKRDLNQKEFLENVKRVFKHQFLLKETA